MKSRSKDYKICIASSERSSLFLLEILPVLKKINPEHFEELFPPMKPLLLRTALTIWAFLVAHTLLGATPAPIAEPGFISLFNGRDLTGWSGAPGFWSVESGTLIGRTTASRPTKGNTFLIAQVNSQNRIVDDFELRFSYRIVADNKTGFANSGVQYRSIDKGNFSVAGYQADFEAGSTYSGILYDESGGAGGRGIMAERGESVKWSADGQKSALGPLGKSAEIQAKIRPNEWNDYVIIARGNELQHFINGVKTVNVVDETSGKRLASGILALQLHAGDPMTVQFKNLRIRSLFTAGTAGGAAVKVAAGFKLESLYTVPKATEGSWVAMCLDPKGRLLVSDQYGALHRVTLPPLTGGVVKTEKINLEVGNAHGLLYAFDSLYVAVNEGNRPHGLYRVRDTNNDDVFDKVELLREIKAGGEHGVHSLVLSPDGQSIYVVVGNQSTLTPVDSSRVPMIWGEDNLLPRLQTGFMDDSLAPQGWIAKTDPEGKKWELISMGLRNEFDVAFNHEGELFTYDADMEWDIGAPWYRPTRVNHVISGAEYGFRNGDGKWPDYLIDSLGAAVNIGPGSPTGISFGYGAKFPAKYQNALFLADWSFGKVRAVYLRPDGSSYTGDFDEFISGQPFPVTDFIINPRDGAMYLAVGGRGAQSALYRVTYTGTESTAPTGPDLRLQKQRDLRHRLEAFHGHADASAVTTVWPFLSNPDRSIRFAARTALEWQDPTGWRERALSEKNPRNAIPALVGLIRVSGIDSAHRSAKSPIVDPALSRRIMAALDRIDWVQLTPSDRVDLLRAWSLAFIRLGRPDETLQRQLATKLEPLFPAKDRGTDLLMAQILAYLQSPQAAHKLMAALRTAPTQEEQIDYVSALREVKNGWTLPLREEYFRWFQKAEGYRGGNTFASSIRTMRKKATEALSETDKTALAGILNAKTERKSPRDALTARSFVKEWTTAELVPLLEQGLQGGRNFERGRKLYGEVACAACHRFGQEGGSVGPELTGVAGRFNLRDMLDAIIEPSKIISDQYEAILVAKKNGETLSGRVANLGGGDLNLVEDMFDPGNMTNIKRTEIESIEPSKISMMPEGLLNSLKADEISDLLAYLFTRGDSTHKSFK